MDTVDLTGGELYSTKFGRSEFSFSSGGPVSVIYHGTDYSGTAMANIYIRISL